jgi:hypothetical protein
MNAMGNTNKAINDEGYESDSGYESDVILPSELAFTENGALAISLEGMTSSTKTLDLSGLPATAALIFSRINDDDVFWGHIVG